MRTDLNGSENAPHPELVEGRTALIPAVNRGGPMTSAADAARTTARILLEIEAVHFRPQQPFTLTSGRASPVYIDCRKIIAFPRARAKIIDLAVDMIEREIGFESLDA